MTGADSEINTISRRTAVDSALVEVLEGERSRFILHRLRSLARSNWAHLVSAAELARTAGRSGGLFDRRRWNIRLLSPMSCSPLSAAESCGRESSHILHHLQRVGRADVVGGQSSPSPREG